MARAALVTSSHGPVEVRDVPEPELEPTGMLAEVEAATLCGTDVHFWEGMIKQEGMPYIPGHETAGRVTQINGERFDIFGEALNPGDRILMAYPWCGHCYYCAVANQPTLCPNAGRFGHHLL